MAEGQVRAASSAWRIAGIRISGAWAGLIAVFAADWLAMFGQWWNSSTYNHILLIPPIIAWLIWQRRDALLAISPRPSSWGLWACGLAALVWVLGAFAEFNLMRQAGAVALLPASVLLLLGPRVVAAALFPLGFMAFLVPFGDELVPALQLITAEITIALVRISAIPAMIDGVFIDTPAGLFEVAESCSGVKFLIAMIALGVLVCNLCFKSWKRRGAFMLLCLLAPILANGLRAWGTIFAAQYVGADRAAGIDHLIYGWIFFALVIAGVLAVSWRYFDREIDDPFVDQAALAGSAMLVRLERSSVGLPLAVLALVAVIGGAKAWTHAVGQLEAPLPPRIDLPQVPGWQRTDYAPQAAWEPRAQGADHRLLGSYADPQGRRVDVFIAVYAAQRDGKEAGGYGQGALMPESGWSWEGEGPAVADAQSDRLRAADGTVRLAQTWYRSGNLLTGSNTRLKLATIADRLQVQVRPTLVLILSAEEGPARDADAALASFRASTGSIAAWMDQIAASR